AGALTLIAEAKPVNERVFDRFTARLNDSVHFAQHKNTVTGQGTGTNAKTDVRRATIQVDVVGQPSSRYTTQFVAVPSAKAMRQFVPPAQNEVPDEGDEDQ